MSEMASFYVERVGAKNWAVRRWDASGDEVVFMTEDELAAKMLVPLLEATFIDAFEAGLVAQRYFPQDIRCFGYTSRHRS